MKRCKLSCYYPGEVCQFAVCCHHDMDWHKLQVELRKRMNSTDVQVVKIRAKGDVHSYKITFSLGRLMTIDTIMGHLESIERDVERALRIKSLAEIVK